MLGSEEDTDLHGGGHVTPESPVRRRPGRARAISV
jgi:hypothetical protein